MDLKKINAYTVYANPLKKYFWVRIRIENPEEETFDVPCETMIDLGVLIDLLRNESNTFFDAESQNIVVGWEPTGENSPLFKKLPFQ